MKSRKSFFTGIFAGIGILILILDAKTAMYGAQEGISLCIRAVIPSLFPFFVLSALLTSSLVGHNFSAAAPLGRLCGIPRGGESLLLTGILGGYPVGAQSIAQAFKSGQLSAADAKRMLGFCNNAGPAFLFGMTSGLFSVSSAAWVLWGIHILSAIIVGIMLPGKSRSQAVLAASHPYSPAQALGRAVSTIAYVCGWVILFRIFLAMLRRWFLWMLPVNTQILITGLLELSNGCLALSTIPSQGLRFLLCACFLGFGGICVAMQTISAANELGTGLYFPGKVIQGCLSILLALPAQVFLFPEKERMILPTVVPVFFLAFVILFAALLKKSANSSRNPKEIGV